MDLDAGQGSCLPPRGRPGRVDVWVAGAPALAPGAFRFHREQGAARAAEAVEREPVGAAHAYIRGGERTGPNYQASAIEPILESLKKYKLPPHLLVDCSHGNSNKDYRRQSEVAHNLAEQIAAGQTGIAGVMLESHLVAGRQDYLQGGDNVYGQSITDACIDLEASATILDALAAAVRARRKKTSVG